MEKDLNYYVSNLESKPLDIHCPTCSFEQSIVYPDKPNPINQKTTNPTKIDVDFQSTTSSTNSLWCALAGIIDDIHLLGTHTMKKNNIAILKQALKDYLSDRTIHAFLTGRRVYPLMELLDKHRIEVEKKHLSALGHFLSFLLNKSIHILENEYKWSKECLESDIKIMKNKEGYWFVEKDVV
jgi:hypothetical protein